MKTHLGNFVFVMAVCTIAVPDAATSSRKQQPGAEAEAVALENTLWKDSPNDDSAVVQIGISRHRAAPTFFEARRRRSPTTPMYKPDWMGCELAIQSAPLANLTLPGTHDSGTYAINDKMLPGTSVPPLVQRVIELYGIRHLVNMWTKTQTQTISEQLQAGIRYFDIRAAPNGNSDDDWVVHHDIFSTSLSIASVMQDVRKFLDLHVKEFVVVEVSHLTGGWTKPTAAQVEWLATMIETTISNDILVARPASEEGIKSLLHETPLEEVQGRCIVTLERLDYSWDTTHAYIWKDYLLYNTYPNKWFEQESYAYNLATLPAFNANEPLPRNGEDFPGGGTTPAVGPDQLFKLSWTLTMADIAHTWSSIIENTVKNCGINCRAQDDINPLFDSFRNSSGCSFLGNMFLIDNVNPAIVESQRIIEGTIASHGGVAKCEKPEELGPQYKVASPFQVKIKSPCEELSCMFPRVCGYESGANKSALICCMKPKVVQLASGEFEYPHQCSD